MDGTLSCGSGCIFDYSACHNCGNNIIDSGEVCDGTNVGSATCQSQGFDDGNLGCLPGCTGFDVSGCFNYPDDIGTRPHFTGKELDEELGWYYLGARYLDPAIGRFFVPDPGELHLENPQSFNRYAYVTNNPFKYDDPDGRALDAIPDAIFVAHDIYDIGRSVARGEGVSVGQVGSLGGNLVGMALPFFTGGGKIARGLTSGRVARAIANGGRALRGRLLQRLYLASAPARFARTTRSAINISDVRLKHVINRHTVGGADVLPGVTPRTTGILDCHQSRVRAPWAGGGGGAEVDAVGWSIFSAGEDVASLIRNAESVAPVAQAGGRFQRTVDAGRTIGVDRITGQATSIYTVITDAANDLVTAFPGTP